MREGHLEVSPEGGAPGAGLLQIPWLVGTAAGDF